MPLQPPLLKNILDVTRPHLSQLSRRITSKPRLKHTLSRPSTTKAKSPTITSTSTSTSTSTTSSTTQPTQPPTILTRTLHLLLPTALILHLVATHILTISLPWGPSMLPTLPLSGSAVLVSLYHRRGRDIRVGHLVTFAHPILQGESAIKRVVGMPGDLVLRDTPRDALSYSGLQEIINDREGEEEQEVQMIRVPKGHCWVSGDNSAASRDSRMFGPVPLALVKGRVLACVWPVSKWSWFGGLGERML